METRKEGGKEMSETLDQFNAQIRRRAREQRKYRLWVIVIILAVVWLVIVGSILTCIETTLGRDVIKFWADDPPSSKPAKVVVPANPSNAADVQKTEARMPTHKPCHSRRTGAATSAALNSGRRRSSEANCVSPAGSIIRRMRVTAYTNNNACCYPYNDGITASGKPVTANGGKFCAADPSIPFGTLITIPGYGTVPVLDRGGAIKGDRFDIFLSSMSAAKIWGVQHLDVVIEKSN